MNTFTYLNPVQIPIGQYCGTTFDATDPTHPENRRRPHENCESLKDGMGNWGWCELFRELLIPAKADTGVTAPVKCGKCKALKHLTGSP